MNQQETLRQWVEESRRIVFFGGAGVSTESGIPDFRSTDGLYHQEYDYPPEEILSHEFFVKNPEEFFRFYWAKMIAPQARPNAAHRVLAKWEAEGRLTAVITQNIDGLHQAAGSRKVYELHGTVHRNHCTRCGRKVPLSEIREHKGVPRCTCGGILKPDVVLYGESLDTETLQKSVQAIEEADMLIIGGTSLSVYPAAGLVHYYRGKRLVLIIGGTSLSVYPAAGLVHYYRGKRLVLINLSETPMDAQADLRIHGSIGKTLEVFL